jgi:hypothetical protein
MTAVRVGSRRVRIRQSELDRFLEAGSQAHETPAAEVDEGSITAWAAFGASMAEATSALESPAQLADALDRLSAASSDLAQALRSKQP